MTRKISHFPRRDTRNDKINIQKAYIRNDIGFFVLYDKLPSSIDERFI